MRRQQKRSLREFVEVYRGWLVAPDVWYSKTLKKSPLLGCALAPAPQMLSGLRAGSASIPGGWNLGPRPLPRPFPVAARLGRGRVAPGRSRSPEENSVGADVYDHSCYWLLCEMLDTLGYTDSHILTDPIHSCWNTIPTHWTTCSCYAVPAPLARAGTDRRPRAPVSPSSMASWPLLKANGHGT